MQILAASLGACAVLTATAACGASHPAAQSSTQTSVPPTASSTASAPVTVTTTGAAPTVTRAVTNPSAAVAGGRCHTPQLKVSLGERDAGLGNGGTPIILTNTGTVTCTLYGYPGIGLLDAARHLDSTTVPRGSSYIFRDPKPRAISLAPGGTASAGFGYSNDNIPADHPGVRCSSVEYLQVTPPDETAPLVIAFSSTAGLLCEVQGITALAQGTNVGSPATT